MKKNSSFIVSILALLALTSSSFAQSYRNNSELTLGKIMKGYGWMGTPPGNPRWSIDGQNIIFTWNPANKPVGSDYRYHLETGRISEIKPEEQNSIIYYDNAVASPGRKEYLFTREGNLYSYRLSEGKARLLIDLSGRISNPFYSADAEYIFFREGNNLFRYSKDKGEIIQLTNFSREEAGSEKPGWSNDQEKWLYNDQQELFDVFKERKIRSEIRKRQSGLAGDDSPLVIPTGKGSINDISINSTQDFITYLLFNPVMNIRNADMPKYVTETGFTETEKVRTKVGYPWGDMKLGIYDVKNDTFYYAQTNSLPGINDFLAYGDSQVVEQREEFRKVYISQPVWSGDRTKALVNIRSTDNKDRWIATLDLNTGSLNCIDHQRDEAWISGPGIGWSTSTGTLGWLPGNSRVFFQSEESGYSHLYIYDIISKKKEAITQGNYEVSDCRLSVDKKYFFFSSNEGDAGQRHFYRYEISSGSKEKLTSMEGQNNVVLSPDEKKVVIRSSYATRPWELYTGRLGIKGPIDRINKITSSLSSEFRSYKWKDPEYISVPSSDGYMIPARLYRPAEGNSNGCGVIFVHGAGYLQNAHKGWSSYFREYMFHNFLVDNGYTVLDMDYRASAGYGRYWRTAIYRHMGGKDLSDNIDGARYLVDKEGVDEGKIGIYGGSYGGFITLMAQFTAPGIFRAGAALRPVTDWAHYNHGYTSNILNTPVEDSLAYRRSSPIYFAEGLEDHLLICHGMVDDNVHFQDVVRLTQRLIELQKDNWEVAMFPVEPHGFREWTSWLDEYKRIYKLFEETLNTDK